MSSPDVCTNYHGGNPESREADPTSKRKASLRLAVEHYVKSRGVQGATSDEVELDLELSHQTASARLTELKIRGYVVPGERRLTRNGRWARALVHVDVFIPETGSRCNRGCIRYHARGCVAYE